MKDAIFAILLNFGSALIPIVYLFATLFRGRHRRAFLITIGIHFLASIGVIALTLWSRSAGYSEWYWTPIYNIPVNMLFGFVYLAILCRFRSTRFPDASNQPTQPK